MVTPLDWQGIIKNAPELNRVRPASESQLVAPVQAGREKTEVTERTERVRPEARPEKPVNGKKPQADARGRKRRPVKPTPKPTASPAARQDLPVASPPPGPVGGHLDITVE